MLADTKEQSVREFKVPDDAFAQDRIRQVLWGAIILLIAITVLLFVLRFLGLLEAHSSLGWVVGFATLGATILAYILAARLGMQRAKRKMIFFLTDKLIIRKRDGWPDDEIAFSEMEVLYERPGWLIAEGSDPMTRIFVPKEVHGFDVIRAELAKHHPLSSAKPRAKYTGTGIVVWIVTALTWIALIVVIYKAMRPR